MWTCRLKRQSGSGRQGRNPAGESPVMSIQHLSFGSEREDPSGKTRVANRTRELRPSGMKRGVCGNVSYSGTRNPPHRSKECVTETLHLRLRAPQFYPDPLFHEAGFCGFLKETSTALPDLLSISKCTEKCACLHIILCIFRGISWHRLCIFLQVTENFVLG
jgi:hypothetical protein